jgi:hypothetical protein
MGAGKIRGAIMLNLHTPLLQDQASVRNDPPRLFVRKPESERSLGYFDKVIKG